MIDPLIPVAPGDAQPELMTVDEVAKLLRLTPDQVRDRAKRGRIPGIVEGMKPRRFRAADIRKWLRLDLGAGLGSDQTDRIAAAATESA